MDDAPPPDMPLSQNLAVLRQCITTLDTAAPGRRPVTHTLQETIGALRGVEEALHQHRDALRRDPPLRHPRPVGRGLSHEIWNP